MADGLPGRRFVFRPDCPGVPGLRSSHGLVSFSCKTADRPLGDRLGSRSISRTLGLSETQVSI